MATTCERKEAVEKVDARLATEVEDHNSQKIAELGKRKMKWSNDSRP